MLVATKPACCRRTVPRFYVRYTETHDFKVELISESPSEVGGYKEIVFGVRGEKRLRTFKFELVYTMYSAAYPQPKAKAAFTLVPLPLPYCPEAEETDKRTLTRTTSV